MRLFSHLTAFNQSAFNNSYLIEDRRRSRQNKRVATNTLGVVPNFSAIPILSLSDTDAFPLGSTLYLIKVFSIIFRFKFDLMDKDIGGDDEIGSVIFFDIIIEILFLHLI